jgi:hypothetical protein
MSSLAKWINALYWLALTVWISVLISAGVAAMSAFTALPDPELGLQLDRFAAHDADRHGQIAAGKVMEPIFTFVDVMQLAAGSIVLLMLVVQLTVLRMSWRRPSNLVRTVCIALAMGLFLFRAATITPGMNKDLRMYWQAAEAGDADTARAAQQSFDAAHQRARPLFDAALLLLLVGVGASAAAFTNGHVRQSDSCNVHLEQPDLLKHK